ncbi:MAG: hypothetical protein A2054_00820 [Deltaproteobacteria bacterium GWA2_55_10]|nr:MAG: hypothetical protein A2054_00820 [Deltaproteobacteria bacterium GWA2_55_10]
MARIKDKFQRILLPIDFSEQSEKAAEYALMLARRDGALLQVMHVLNVSSDITGLLRPSNMRGMLREVEAGLAKFMAKHLKGYDNVAADVLSGVPHSAIVNYAKKNKSDVIVIGSHGKGALDRLIVGSNTERVLRKAPCPVLVVPPKG